MRGEGGGEKLWEQPVEEFSFRSKKGSVEEEKVGTMTERVNLEEKRTRFWPCHANWLEESTTSPPVQPRPFNSPGELIERRWSHQ